MPQLALLQVQRLEERWRDDVFDADEVRGCFFAVVDDALQEVVGEDGAVMVCAYFGGGVAREEVEAVEEEDGAFGT